MSELLLVGADTQARLCQNLQDPPLGRPAWNKLLARSETRSVFLTWQWLSTWWECFHEGADLFVFAVERDDELIGIAPLQLRRRNGRRIIEFLGMGSSDYCDFIASEDDKPAVVQSVAEALFKRRDRWDEMSLRYVPAQGSTSELLAALRLPPGWELRCDVESQCPALSIQASRAFAQTCAQKKSLVRHTRYFERLAPLEFHHALDVDEILDRLPDFFEQHRDRRFMAGDQSLFDDPRHRRFYERMVPALVDAGWLRFGVLRWNNEVLAYHLGFLHERIFTWYKPTFNVDYARFSPGEVLLKKLLEEALATGVEIFDFTVGDEAFKERFANVKNQNLHIVVAPQSRRRWRQGARESAKAFLRNRSPRLYARLRAARDDLQRGPRIPEHLNEAVSTRAPGARATTRRRTLPWGITSHVLWRAAPLQPTPSEFSAQWARYSHLKSITRREGLNQMFLLACLEKLRRGERAVVAIWHERPVALLWIAGTAAAAAVQEVFREEIPAGSAVITDAYLALDFRGSPRREALPPMLMTFLAAEGITALYGIQDTRHPAPLLAQCGTALTPIARRMDWRFLRWRFRPHKRFAAGS